MIALRGKKRIALIGSAIALVAAGSASALSSVQILQAASNFTQPVGNAGLNIPNIGGMSFNLDKILTSIGVDRSKIPTWLANILVSQGSSSVFNNDINAIDKLITAQGGYGQINKQLAALSLDNKVAELANNSYLGDSGAGIRNASNQALQAKADVVANMDVSPQSSSLLALKQISENIRISKAAIAEQNVKVNDSINNVTVATAQVGKGVSILNKHLEYQRQQQYKINSDSNRAAAKNNVLGQINPTASSPFN